MWFSIGVEKMIGAFTPIKNVLLNEFSPARKPTSARLEQGRKLPDVEKAGELREKLADVEAEVDGS